MNEKIELEVGNPLEKSNICNYPCIYQNWVHFDPFLTESKIKLLVEYDFVYQNGPCVDKFVLVNYDIMKYLSAINVG